MNAPFIPDAGYEFAQDEVLAHWHHMACRNHIAQMAWQSYVEDPF